jgi:hypothetical protein
MYLKKSMSNGKPYLSFVQGYRQDGKVKQKTIEKLGYLEDLEKVYPDPITHFKQVAKERSDSGDQKHWNSASYPYFLIRRIFAKTLVMQYLNQSIPLLTSGISFRRSSDSWT